jgi:hypothetical protein
MHEGQGLVLPQDAVDQEGDTEMEKATRREFLPTLR